MERDYVYILSYKATSISTHTLTWSVTGLSVKFIGYFGISTHTLTWSVTPRNSETGLKTFYFNSHAHVERDGDSIAANNVFVISTHTLTWSVTNHHKHFLCTILFQLTRSRGA